jgi:tetratricopeptide (TPR) repeat protein
LVANTLSFLGYEPVWQDIFGTGSGDLRDILRRQIDRCKGVIQLIGRSYGAEPPSPDPQFGRISYTQFEALYARQRGKKVWYFLIDEGFPVDQFEVEPEELGALQAAYRDRLRGDSYLFHALSSSEGLEASVLKLRTDLVRLERGVKQWAAAVALLLVMLVVMGLWLLREQRHATQQIGETKQAVFAVSEEIVKFRRGVMRYPEIEGRVRQAYSSQDAAAVQESVYAELAKWLNLDPTVVRAKLPQIARDWERDPNATSYERANAAYVAGDYAPAEQMALRAEQEAQANKSADSGMRMQALKLAGLSAHKRIQFSLAMEHFRVAEQLTDRRREPAQWSEIQHAIADLLLDQGQYRVAKTVLESVVEERTRFLGAEHIDTLRSRSRLAYALWRAGRYREAEESFRQIVAVEDKILGPEHSDTLLSRNGFALTLDDNGNHSEAEVEHRQILQIRSRILGPEHPDTLRSRNNLALALNREGRHTAAENDFRELVRAEERVLGLEHPETLRTRTNLIAAVGNQGKDAEAETEFRELVRLEKKVLGPQHPDTLRTCTNLAYALAKQGRFEEAENEFRATVPMEVEVLGPEHPATLATRMGLAGVLAPQKKFAEAEAEYREVIALQERVLGKDHPDTLESCYHFAYDLARQGKLTEAADFARRAADAARKVLGPDHPSTQKYTKLSREVKGEN